MAVNLSYLNTKQSFPIKTRPTFRRPPPPRMPSATAVAIAGNRSYWEAIEADINSYLKKAIPIRSPETVFEPMHHLTLSAPATTASALCVAACELVGGDRSHAIAAAAAIHLMHAAAHAHEHLPLTDGSRPQPKPEIQHKFKPNIELLTGDGIAPFAFELLARSTDDPARNENPDRILRVIIEISQAAGSQGLIDGLYKESEIVDPHSRFGFIEYVCRKKYGEMHGCGAACGAILAGGADEEIEKLRNFGLYAGTVRALMEVGNAPEIEKIVIRLKDLALKEMEGFRGEKAELISDLVAEPISDLVAEPLLV